MTDERPHPNATAYVEFWAWFRSNEERLYHFESDQDQILGELGERLERVHGDLCFEFSPVRDDGTREFVVSAGGIAESFPVVEAMVSAAPELPRWRWVRLRPRRPSFGGEISIAGDRLNTDQVRFKLYRDGEKVGIALFIDGLTEARREALSQAAWILLDAALGEFTIETQVGFVDLLDAEHRHAAGACPVEELPAAFDRALAE